MHYKLPEGTVEKVRKKVDVVGSLTRLRKYRT